MAPETPAFEGVPLDDVLRQVKLAVRIFMREAKPEDRIKLKSLELTLNVCTELTAELKPKFTIPVINLEIGSKLEWIRENTQEIVITLGPEEVGAAPEGDFVGQLVDGLRLIRDSARVAGEDEPRLFLTKGTVELKFVVTATGSIELLIFSAGGSRALTHSLKVEVGPPAEATAA
jgi:Trypsin-co-occurring domain 2